MRPNEILMKWALRPADNHSFCDGGEGSGHGFDAAQLWLVQMVTVALVRVPNRLRCLPSNAGQVLAADRCGISVICKWCRRAKLVPREEMTWLSQLFAPWLQGKRGQEYRGENFTATDATTLPEGTFTFWLLPKNMRWPLLPGMPRPNRVSRSHPAQWHAAMEYLPLFSFTRWELWSHIGIFHQMLWWKGGGLEKQHISRVLLCIWM